MPSGLMGLHLQPDGQLRPVCNMCPDWKPGDFPDDDRDKAAGIADEHLRTQHPREYANMLKAAEIAARVSPNDYR